MQTFSTSSFLLGIKLCQLCKPSVVIGLMWSQDLPKTPPPSTTILNSLRNIPPIVYIYIYIYMQDNASPRLPHPFLCCVRLDVGHLLCIYGLIPRTIPKVARKHKLGMGLGITYARYKYMCTHTHDVIILCTNLPP